MCTITEKKEAQGDKDVNLVKALQLTAEELWLFGARLVMSALICSLGISEKQQQIDVKLVCA